MTTRIIQRDKLPTRDELDREDVVLVVVPVRRGGAALTRLAYGQLLERQLRREGPASRARQIATTLPNARDTRCAAANWPASLGTFERLSRARRLCTAACGPRTTSVAVVTNGFDEAESLAVVSALLAALLAATAPMPNYQNDHKHGGIRRIRVYGVESPDEFARVIAEAEGNNLARELTTLPPNYLTPADYVERVRALATDCGWRFRFIDEAALERIGAGAFLAVCQGSPTRDAGIVHLEYRPRVEEQRAPVALVGKGICFDTGGVNLKSSRYMLGMHGDMQGSAVALGSLLALTRLRVDYPVDCWLALARNHVGERAYIPNDVVTASDGTTIEVVHTDAEGRMVLADTLIQVRESKPRLTLDFATLTGACVGAVGKRYSGCFSNDPAFNQRMIDAGAASGERVWPFPMDADFDQDFKSEIADTKQCSEGGGPDHILAARFLKRFIGDAAPWVHVDLASGENKGGLAHVPTDVIGFGVRLSCALLLDDVLRDDLDAA